MIRFKNLRPIDIIILAYQTLMLLTIVFHFNKLQNPVLLFLINLTIILLVFALIEWQAQKVPDWIKAWYPVLVVPMNFSELHYLIHNINPIDLDNALIKIDYALFGVHPTVWMEKLLNPWLTEYLQLVYTSFYFLPLILGWILFQRKKMEVFNYFVFVILYGFYASYIGYFTVPAIGPRFTLDYMQTTGISGVWLTGGIRHTLDTLENIQRDAFPSGHTEMTLLTMIYAYKYSRKYFYVLTIVGTSLIFSTVYLRYHYVIDVIAGLVLAILIAVSAEYVYNKLKQLPVGGGNK